jgi:hypothetical protein
MNAALMFTADVLIEKRSVENWCIQAVKHAFRELVRRIRVHEEAILW